MTALVERVGLRGALVALGAAAGLAAIVTGIVLLAPVRGQVANIRSEGEVARILASAPTGAAGQAAECVRADVEPFYEAHRADLDAIGDRPSPTLSHGLRRLELWSELKIAWAKALADQRVALATYVDFASAHPHPMDRLLVPPMPAPAN